MAKKNNSTSDEINIKYFLIPKLKKKGKEFMISRVDANRMGKI